MMAPVSPFRQQPWSKLLRGKALVFHNCSLIITIIFWWIQDVTALLKYTEAQLHLLNTF